MTTASGLFHCAVGLPRIAYPQGWYALHWSGHARQAANERGIPILPKFNTKGAVLIEAELLFGVPVKYLYRMPWKPGRDICLAVVPLRNRPWDVKTAYLSRPDDNHSTLDKTKYSVM